MLHYCHSRNSADKKLNNKVLKDIRFKVKSKPKKIN